MANILKKAVSGLLEKMFTPAKVIAVRAWQPATMYEIDIHLPTIDMAKWDTIKRLKCRVGELAYRDYTPALWNAEKKVCTMYIEAGHNGAGGRWVQQLKEGDEILVGEAHAAQLPAKEGNVLCLADGSALGHFLGLKQLTTRENYPIEAAVFLHDNYQLPALLTETNPEFDFIIEPNGNRLDTLIQWCMSKELSRYTSICIAGNIPMVTGLRKMLKALPDVHARIYSYGFWS